LELSRNARPLQIAQFALVREVPSWSHGVVLAVYMARPTSGSVAVVVVLRLCAEAWSTAEPVPGLTRRETEVARLIAAGLATKEIAFRLEMSTHTARHHTERVFEKLGVRNRAGVAALLGTRAY